MNDHGRAFNWFTPLRFGALLALVIFATFPQVILGLQTFIVRDFAFFSFPVATFQRDCFWHGQLPFWNPYNYCGIPFLAQWNTIALYPPALLYLLLPLQWSLSFFSLLHLWFGGMGMYFLARRWTGNDLAAAFAGMAFSFNGVALNLLMWPSHIATLSWTPWVILAVEKAWRDGGRHIFIAALAGAMQMLAGGPETVVFTWMSLGALWSQQLIKNEAPRRLVLWRFPATGVLAIALSAIQLLPFLDLAAHSQRHIGYADMRWSMPAWGWMNYLVPMAYGGTWNENVFFQYGQYWTTSYYPGIAVLWLTVLAIWKVRDRRVYLLGAVVVAAFIFALGENTFIYPALRKMFPPLSLITYPIKYVLLITFFTPLLAAFALRHITTLEDRRQSQRQIALPGFVLLALLAGVLVWTTQFPFPTDDVHATLVNGLGRIFFLGAAGVVLLFLARTSPTPGIAGVVLIFVTWLDMFTHEPKQNPAVSPGIYQRDLARNRVAMSPQPELGQSRVMIAPVAFFQSFRTTIRDPYSEFLVKRLAYLADCNLIDRVPKVDGFFSLYTLESGNLLDRLYSSDDDFSRLEDFMSISHISTATNFIVWRSRATYSPMITAGQEPVFMDPNAAFYQVSSTNFDGRRIVFLPPEAKSLVTVTHHTNARVLQSHFDNQRVEIEVQADQPSMVVIGQTWYHNWRADVDGVPTPVFQANYAFQAVQVPAGPHRVRLVYRDRAFAIGAAISAGALLFCLGAIVFCRRKKVPNP